MKTSFKFKGILLCGIAALTASCIMFGCSANGSTSNANASSSNVAEAYPEHAANCEGGDGIASYHMALGNDCTTCHGDDLSDQVSAIAASADGELPLASTYYTSTDTCLTSGCHDSWESLAKKTSDLGEYNPHDSIHGTIEDCNECHKGHDTQVDICGECHPNGGQEMLH